MEATLASQGREPAGVTPDVTDLLALPAVLLAWWLLRRARTARAPHGALVPVAEETPPVFSPPSCGPLLSHHLHRNCPGGRRRRKPDASSSAALPLLHNGSEPHSSVATVVELNSAIQKKRTRRPRFPVRDRRHISQQFSI